MIDLSAFGPARIDTDEWRDTPIRHRFVHGGFEGTDTRFSLYLPPPERYEGRLIQWLEGGSAGHERTIENGGALTDHALEQAFALGAFVVESNQGHLADEPSRPKAEGSVLSYVASVATARHSRVIAEEMYGAAPHHAYVYGVSGGGLRSIVCLERGEGTWDGAVPCAIPHSGMFYGLTEHTARTLGTAVDSVVDAMDVGGNNDPFAGLDVDQRTTLADLYRAGFPRGAEFMLRPGYAPIGYGMTTLYAHDPGYFDAFWSEPGYAGHDRPDLLTPMRLEIETSVAAVLTPRELFPPGTPSDMVERFAAMFGGLDAPVAAMFDGLSEEDSTKLLGATLRFTSGAGAGRLLYAAMVVGPVVVGSSYSFGETFEGVVPGDRVVIDNAHNIAFRFAYRHEATVEEERFGEVHPEWRHLTVDGVPVYPQRRPAWTFDTTFASELYLHHFTGKMLLVQNAMDGTNLPSHGHNYATRVRAAQPDADDVFRLYWTDHAAHGPASFYPPGDPPVVTTRVIDYGGLLGQALADLIAWVEEGIEPPLSTRYTWGDDGLLSLAPEAHDRGGLQPVVTLAADGDERAEVACGHPVNFDVTAEAPPGTGSIVAMEWDFAGTGLWEVREDDIDGSSASVERSRKHSYDTPGTYFPAVRVWSSRRGDVSDPLFRVANLGRVRVVVDSR
jgi:hypothetical protein